VTSRLWPALLAVSLTAVVVAAQPYVLDSIDVGGAGVGSLAYNRASGVLYGRSTDTYYFFAISCDSGRVVSRIYRRTPYYIAFDSTDCKAYFTQRTDNIDSVIVVDGQTQQYLKGIPLLWATLPVWDGVDDRLYVSCDEENVVGVIDCRTDSVIRIIPTGLGPLGMDINTRHRKLYVRNYDGESVSIVDMATGQVLRTIPLRMPPYSGCYHPSADKYYVGGAGEVVSIDGGSDTIVSTIRLPTGTEAICLTPVETPGVVLVGADAMNNDSIYVIDYRSDSILAVLQASRSPSRIVRSPVTGLAYSASRVQGRLDVINEDCTRILTTIPTAPAAFALELALDRGLLYVGHLDSRMVYVIRDSSSGIEEPILAQAGQSRTLRVSPNPFHHTTTIDLCARASAGPSLRILSLDGRQRRVLEPSQGQSGRSLGYVWDGMDSEGRPVPAGVYLAVPKEAGARVKLLKLD
jgi:YVTN family beta-propeller protein